jgi:hypothetical protein
MMIELSQRYNSVLVYLLTLPMITIRTPLLHIIDLQRQLAQALYLLSATTERGVALGIVHHLALYILFSWAQSFRMMLPDV